MPKMNLFIVVIILPVFCFGQLKSLDSDLAFYGKSAWTSDIKKSINPGFWGVEFVSGFYSALSSTIDSSFLSPLSPSFGLQLNRYISPSSDQIGGLGIRLNSPIRIGAEHCDSSYVCDFSSFYYIPINIPINLMAGQKNWGVGYNLEYGYGISLNNSFNRIHSISVALGFFTNALPGILRLDIGFTRFSFRERDEKRRGTDAFVQIRYLFLRFGNK